MNEMRVRTEPGAAVSLSGLLEKIGTELAEAKSAAEILDAREKAKRAYNEAKQAARFAKMKSAHESVVNKAHRLMGDAQLLEQQADWRLADEYDAAQKRGEIASPADRHSNSRLESKKANAKDLFGAGGEKIIHEARKSREREKANPGATKAAIDKIVEMKKEPKRSAVEKVITEAMSDIMAGKKPKTKAKPKPAHEPIEQEDAHLINIMISATCDEIVDLIGRFPIPKIARSYDDAASVAIARESHQAAIAKLQELEGEIERCQTPQ